MKIKFLFDMLRLSVFRRTSFTKLRQASLRSMIALSIFLGLSLEGLAQDITISTASTSNISTSTSGNVVTYTVTNNSSPAVLNVGTINTQLNANNGVSIVAPGTITVTSGISAGGSNMLTFKAASTITINQNVTRAGSGGITLRPGYGSTTGTVNGTGALNLSGSGSSLLLATGTTMSNNIREPLKTLFSICSFPSKSGKFLDLGSIGFR